MPETSIVHLTGEMKQRPRCPHCRKVMEHMGVWDTGNVLITFCAGCQMALGATLLPDAIEKMRAAVPPGQSAIKTD